MDDVRLFGYLQPPTLELSTYASTLYERRMTAVVVPRKMIEIHGWRPEPNECHANASTCAAVDPRVTAVRGWLICEYPGAVYLRFTAHSVIELDDGELVDITPVPPLIWKYPFLRANVPDSEFHAISDALISAHGYAHLDHLLK